MAADSLPQYLWFPFQVLICCKQFLDEICSEGESCCKTWPWSITELNQAACGRAPTSAVPLLLLPELPGNLALSGHPDCRGNAGSFAPPAAPRAPRRPTLTVGAMLAALHRLHLLLLPGLPGSLALSSHPDCRSNACGHCEPLPEALAWTRQWLLCALGPLPLLPSGTTLLLLFSPGLAAFFSLKTMQMHNSLFTISLNPAVRENFFQCFSPL